MLNNVVLLLALVALVPLPPLSRKQLQVVGVLFLVGYTLSSLACIVASHFIFFVDSPPYSLVVLILLIAIVAGKRAWQFLWDPTGEDGELATLCVVGVFLLELASSLVMWVASAEMTPSILLWPPMCWELYLFIRNRRSPPKEHSDADIESQHCCPRNKTAAPRIGYGAKQWQQKTPVKYPRLNLKKSSPTGVFKGK